MALAPEPTASMFESTPLLVIDEVNFTNLQSAALESTASFIQDLFQTIAKDRCITCIVASNMQKTADFLVDLNGGKIKPRPSFTTAAWTRGQNVAWDDARWIVQQLRALLDLKYPNFPNINYAYLEDGMTPGDALANFVRSQTAFDN